jgi:hypothetical protein
MLNFIRWCEGKRKIKDAPGQMSLWNDKGEPTVPQPEPEPAAPAEEPVTFKITPSQYQELMDGPNGYSSGRFKLEKGKLIIAPSEVPWLIRSLRNNYESSGGIETVSNAMRRSMLGLADFLDQKPAPPPTLKNGMLNMQQCAKYLQVAPRTVMKWVDSKRLPATLDEKKDRWVRPADLVKFMTDNSLADPPQELLSLVGQSQAQRVVMPGEGKTQKSPILRQYEELKSRHPGMIILFRKGDFYELFYEDAERVANLLKLPITRRQDGATTVSMTGFPHKDLEGHLRKMLSSKLRVAIADEVK